MIAEVEAIKPKWALWDIFATSWDICIDQAGELHFITPETDINFVLQVCNDARMRARKGYPWEWNARELNVISILESEMLEGITSWENFNDVWYVELDRELKRISIKQLKRPAGQRDIRPEEYAPVEFTDAETADPNTIEGNVMSDEEVAEFRKLLAASRKKTAEKKNGK